MKKIRFTGENFVIKVGLILTFFNIVIGVLGYVFQLSMGRLLSAGDFADFIAIMAFSMILSAPLAAMVLVISRAVAFMCGLSRETELRSLYLTSLKLIFFWLAAFLCMAVAARSIWSQIVNVDSVIAYLL